MVAHADRFSDLGECEAGVTSTVKLLIAFRFFALSALALKAALRCVRWIHSHLTRADYLAVRKTAELNLAIINSRRG